MTRHVPAPFPLCAALLLAASAAGAEKLSLSFAGSTYQDAKEVALRTPEGVACTDQGAVLVADSGNGRLLNYKYKEGVFSLVSEVKFPQLGYPVRVQIDSSGNALSLDQRTRRIVRVGASGFAGYLEPTDVPGAAPFPVAFKIDKKDGVWLLDLTSQRVLSLDPAGKFLRAVPLPKGSFTDLAVDAQGRLFVVEAISATLFSAGPQDAELKPLGKSLKGYMSFPMYVAVADHGFLLLVDRHGNGLVAVGPDGAFLGRRLSIGRQDGFLYYPSQLCLSDGGDAFVADRGNNRVQAFTVQR